MAEPYRSTLLEAILAYERGDFTALDAYERTHPGTDVGPDAQAYHWAGAQVRAFVAYIVAGHLSPFPTEILALAEQIEAGPTAAQSGWSPWAEKPDQPAL